MLKNSFYSVQSLMPSEQGLSAIIHIHPEHKIFEGHFPGKPVVPGVCMIQIVKELMETQLQKPLLLQKASQIKFLQLLLPQKEEPVTVNISWKITDEYFQTTADFKKESAAVFKLSGTFKAIP